MASSKTVRVLFDAAGMAHPPTGVGIYAWELASALAATKDVQVFAAFPDTGPAGVVTYTAPRAHLQLWRQFVLPWRLAKDRFHVYHGTQFTVPVVCPTPRVATVHDLSFVKFPRAYTRPTRFQFNAFLRASLRAERIITHSAAVADDLVSRTSYPRSRIRVVHLAPSTALSGSPVPSPGEDITREPYLLFVGLGSPRKRAVDVVRALSSLPDVHAVFVGEDLGGAGSLLMREATRLGLSDRVVLTGHVDPDVLHRLYTGALALVYPSLDEGFGIPPLEAMTRGTPVIATDIPVLREVLGDAALFVPTRAPEEIARASARLLDEGERNEWVARGLEHASGFSWERAADATAAVYREFA